jgi:hypothetical protein
MIGNIFKDPEFNMTMIMSHHSYSTSLEFFDALVKRYDVAPPYGLNQKNFDLFVKNKVLPVRLR